MGAGADPRQHYRIWRNTAVYHDELRSAHVAMALYPLSAFRA